MTAQMNKTWSPKNVCNAIFQFKQLVYRQFFYRICNFEKQICASQQPSILGLRCLPSNTMESKQRLPTCVTSLQLNFLWPAYSAPCNTHPPKASFLSLFSIEFSGETGTDLLNSNSNNKKILIKNIYIPLFKKKNTY